MPTSMTDPHHLPLHPLMDHTFLAELRRHGVRVGLFYRDIYWRFPAYGTSLPWAQREAALAMYRFDVMGYRMATDIIYLPSARMQRYFDPQHRLRVAELPPGHDVARTPEPVAASPLRLLYVGGVNDHYRLDALVEAMRRMPEAHLTICTREAEWQQARASYEPVPANIEVVHRNGEELHELFERSNVTVVYAQPTEYWTFAAPVKLSEYLGHGKPVIAASGTLSGEIVDEYASGWAIPYGADDLEHLLRRLQAHPEEVDAAAAAARRKAPDLTWTARAQQVADDLGRVEWDLPQRLLMVGAAHSIHTARWANAMCRAGLDVHLASLTPPGDQRYDEGVTLHQLPRARGLGYVAAAPALRRLVEELRPDLVNTHYATGYGTLAHLALTGSSVPNLLSVWGADVYDVPLKSRAHELVVRGNLESATAIASTSRAMARQTRRWCGDEKQIFLTPFGIDLDAFPLRAEPGTLESQDGEVVVGTVKTLHPKYGVDTLIESFALARATRPWLRLEIYGDGPQRAELEELVTRLGQDDAVRLHGAVPHDQVPAAMRSLDVYVALSRLDSESFGVAILEASASGVPVVVSDASGPAEVTVDEVTGFVVPREDPQAAAEAIGRLVDDPGLRRRMGLAGRAHVEQVYTWQASVDSMLDAYRGTLALASRQPR